MMIIIIIIIIIIITALLLTSLQSSSAVTNLMAINSNQTKCWFYEVRGKPEYPEKNLSEQSTEPHMTPSLRIVPRPHW